MEKKVFGQKTGKTATIRDVYDMDRRGFKIKSSTGKQGQDSASAPVSAKLTGNLSTDTQAWYLDPLFI